MVFISILDSHSPHSLSLWKKENHMDCFNNMRVSISWQMFYSLVNNPFKIPYCLLRTNQAGFIRMLLGVHGWFLHKTGFIPHSGTNMAW